jgi:hypothetical protein
MEIRIRQTGEVVTESQFRSMHKGSSLPQLSEALLNELGADIVFEGPQASGGDQYQYSQRQGVEQIGGKWYTKYVLGPIFTDNEDATAAQQEAAYKAQKDAEQATAIRNDRNKRLADSDWTQLADSTADKAAWATYRQALRDITTQAGFPWNVTWPDAP